MSPIRWMALAAAVLGLRGASLADVGSQAAEDPLWKRIAELEAKSARDDARIGELESRFSALQRSEENQWLTQQRADEIRMLVEDILADAETRSSLLLGSGYDGGAVIGGGDWMLRTNIHMQQRLILNDRTAGSEWGFENTRTKFILTGNVVSPEWFYKAEIEVVDMASTTDFPNAESRTGLLDSFVGYDFGNDWKVRVGTFKAPLLREELVDSRYQLAVERSVVNYLYTGGRTDGLAADYYGDRFHFTGSFNNGINDATYGGGVRTGGQPALSGNIADSAYTLRGEFLIEGNWDQFSDFSSTRGEKTAMMVGGAIHLQSAADELRVLTLDFSGKFGGRNVYAAIIRANLDAGGGADRESIGFVLQGGYRFDDEWEGFARYEWSDIDVPDMSIFTVGITRFLSGHHAKWTTDIGVALDPVPETIPVTGWQAFGTDGQVVIRSQLQLVY